MSLLILLLIFTGTNYSSDNPREAYNKLIDQQKLDDSPFLLGEELVYSISYLGVTGGELVLKINDIIFYDGSLCYDITATIKSNRTFSMFFRVDNFVRTIYDVIGGFSRKYHIRQREGRYRNERTILLDYKNKRADYIVESTEDIQVKVLERYLQDSLSIFYEIRKQDFESSSMFEVPIISGSSEYDLKIELLGRRRINSAIGRFNTYQVKPFLHKEGEFKDKGDLVIYITDDHRRIPVLMELEVVFGNVRATLSSARIPQLK